MTKKSFKDSINPALNFISQETTPETAGEAPTGAEIDKPPVGYKVNPLYIETRSKRLQLLMQPSLYDKLKNKAKKEQTSVNDLIHTILQEAMKGER